MDDAVSGLNKGSRVWYRKDAATWLLAEIRDGAAADGNGGSASGQPLSIQLLDSGKVVEGILDGQGQLVPANPALQRAIADLTQLSYLNEPSILDNLTQRYQADNIYTNAGPVLIAVNPCRNLPLYTAEVAQEYKCRCCSVVAELGWWWWCWQGFADVGVVGLPPQAAIIAAAGVKCRWRDIQQGVGRERMTTHTHTLGRGDLVTDLAAAAAVVGLLRAICVCQAGTCDTCAVCMLSPPSACCALPYTTLSHHHDPPSLCSLPPYHHHPSSPTPHSWCV